MTEPRLTDSAAQYERMRGATDYLAFIKATALSALVNRNAHELLTEHIGGRADRFKAAVEGNGTTSTGLAQRRLSRDYLAGLVPTTVLGQLLGAVPVPANTTVPSAMLTTTADFVAEGAAAPLVAATLSTSTILTTKMSLLVAVANELLKLTDDRALGVVDRVLRRALVRGANNALLSTEAAVEGVSPAGLLHGVSPAGMGSPSNLDDDLLATVLLCRGGVPEMPVWVLSPLGAAYLQATGLQQFAGVSMHTRQPGRLFGAPQIATEAARAKAILIDAAAITYADEGLAVEAAGSATLQQDDTPTNDALTGTGASLVSMFQTRATALKCEWFVHWSKADDAVAYCDLPLPTGSPAW